MRPAAGELVGAEIDHAIGPRRCGRERCGPGDGSIGGHRAARARAERAAPRRTACRRQKRPRMSRPRAPASARGRRRGGDACARARSRPRRFERRGRRWRCAGSAVGAAAEKADRERACGSRPDAVEHGRRPRDAAAWRSARHAAVAGSASSTSIAISVVMRADLAAKIAAADADRLRDALAGLRDQAGDLLDAGARGADDADVAARNARWRKPAARRR